MKPSRQIESDFLSDHCDDTASHASAVPSLVLGSISNPPNNILPLFILACESPRAANRVTRPPRRSPRNLKVLPKTPELFLCPRAASKCKPFPFRPCPRSSDSQNVSSSEPRLLPRSKFVCFVGVNHQSMIRESKREITELSAESKKETRFRPLQK